MSRDPTAIKYPTPLRFVQLSNWIFQNNALYETW